MNSPCQNTAVGSLSFLQGTFPTQGSNPDLLHCRQIHYQLSHSKPPKFKKKKKIVACVKSFIRIKLQPTAVHSLQYTLRGIHTRGN